MQYFRAIDVVKDSLTNDVLTVDPTQADISEISPQKSPPRNRIWIRVTPKENNPQRHAEYEYWSGTYTFDCHINGKPSYKHSSGNFVLWFDDKKSKC